MRKFIHCRALQQGMDNWICSNYFPKPVASACLINIRSSVIQLSFIQIPHQVHLSVCWAGTPHLPLQQEMEANGLWIIRYTLHNAFNNWQKQTEVLQHDPCHTNGQRKGSFILRIVENVVTGVPVISHNATGWSKFPWKKINRVRPYCIKISPRL